jgi:lysophospholipase L1-like esterase
VNDLLRPDDVLLFQGDSITMAFRMPQEVNDAYQLGAGYVLMAGARLLAAGGHPGLRVMNRGVPGHRLSDCAARWQEDCLDQRPSVLSVLVGINDVLQHPDLDVAAWEDAYDALLRRTVAALPGLRLVLIEPFCFAIGAISAQQADLVRAQRAAVRRLAAAHGARLVELQDAFDRAAGHDRAAWIYDGVHPTARGAWLIACRWLETVTGDRLVGLT